ncbi:discoidin domain-containing protein [Metasolibacillus meyeri]|uniref:Discoidin domain-containing protein n=1 Tax=Metasolibacillus meyeri TaxID=1071052 RepID=A0AAW9NTU3_9BACL|nr:discoidin domain-containing protein [Metasolibacillus meyeri]MEC1179204.1 discoidin domain-containing protein [Metasolibacillus meyeri]
MGKITWYDLKMTSNTTPYPLVASASALHNNNSTAWGAFNGLPSGQWITPDNVGIGSWIQIYLGEETKVNSIQINPRNDNFFYQNPYKFKIQYSTDGNTWTDSEIIESHKFRDRDDIFRARLNSDMKARYFRLYVTELFAGNNNISIGRIVYGYENANRLALKNPTTSQYYSLSENTLIHLPNNSPKNMILHGIEQEKAIQLDVPFTKHNYVNESPVDNVNGTVFTQNIGKINTLNIREIKEDNFEPIYTWHETNMTSNTTPAPLIASASSEFSSTLASWKAFNGTVTNSEDAWCTLSGQAKNSHITLDFGENKDVSVFSITPRFSAQLNQTPKAFDLQMSNDNQTFTTVKSYNYTSWIAQTAVAFNLDEKVEGRFFRVFIRENMGNANFTGIADIKFGIKKEVN